VRGCMLAIIVTDVFAADAKVGSKKTKKTGRLHSKNSEGRFRSVDLRVMSPARSHCATSLGIPLPGGRAEERAVQQ
jgi:hypothetical protein